ncbi:VWA domain-containing protein [Chloroflexota bacterium]
MNTLLDYYAILGVAPEANGEDVKAAYRRAARRFHPDANPNPGATSQFRDITEAYDILGDAAARIEFDRSLRENALPPPYYSLRVTPSKRVLKSLDDPQVIYLLAEISPDARFIQDTEQETILNLALVIDRSTSMKGPRLDRVKQAAHKLIDNLSPNDILSVVSFSDRADIVFEATPAREKTTLKAMTSTMQASGGTEIYQGLAAGIAQLHSNMNRKYVNHLILLTDGQTYGDEQLCLELAEEVATEGIGISTIGIGQEWNDVFLDELASRTGGSSTYINSPSAIVRFLDDQVRSLGASFAERLHLSIAPDADITLEDAFKLTPSPQPLPIDVERIPLGSLEKGSHASIILQLQMPALPKEEFRTVVRLDVTGDILHEGIQQYKALSDFSIEIATNVTQENPPMAILEALGKLTLYRMQEKAQDSIEHGDVREATRRLQNLATRLLEQGQDGLAHAAIAEARRVARTSMLSEEGQKTLKYGTRALLMPPSMSEDD